LVAFPFLRLAAAAPCGAAPGQDDAEGAKDAAENIFRMRASFGPRQTSLGERNGFASREAGDGESDATETDQV
jgi:hypothetical protein